MTRSGFIGLAGRPNVGKSTLVNAIVGQKVAIISDRPQTTRRAVRGIATDTDAAWQMVLVDLPGFQKPRDSLTERMQRRVERELADADCVLFLVNGEQGLGPGDRFIAEMLMGGADRPRVICAVNKCDVVKAPKAAEVLTEVEALGLADSIHPISARTGDGVPELIEDLVTRLPDGPYMYPPEDRTDSSSEVHLAELIREQVLNRTRAEVPHAVEVFVDSAELRDDGLFEVKAQVWVETESQKAILIGKGGRMVRDIGTAARHELEHELGGKVFLDLRVRVRERWRRDEGLLDRLGIE